MSLQGPDHMVPQQKNEAATTGRPQHDSNFSGTHYASVRNFNELNELKLPNRKSNAYGHTFGAGASDNADARQRVRSGHAELIRLLGNGPESSSARQVHEQRYDYQGEAATIGNAIHSNLESVWTDGRVTKHAIPSTLQGWALSGSMPEVALDLKVRVGGEDGKRWSKAGVIPEFGNWNPMLVFACGLVGKPVFNLAHDFIQPKYLTGIGARRNGLEVLAEKSRVNARQASEIRAGSAGARIVQAYGEDGRDHLEDTMNETDRSVYDYMKAMQQQTWLAMEPDQHLRETGVESAALQATLARFAEADFLTTFAGRSEKAQPVVYYWQPPGFPDVGLVRAATDPLTGTPPTHARARKDVSEAERPQRWDYRPDPGALLAEVGKAMKQIPSLGDYALARANLMLAKFGNHAGLVQLGEMCEDGRLGMAQGANSGRLAEQLYEIPARQGNAQAQYRLGRMLAKGGASGSAEPKSDRDRLAVEWLQKAAKQDHLEACAELGLMHAANRTGLNDEQASGSQACTWLRKAVKLRSPEVLFTLGLMHETRRSDVRQVDDANHNAEKWYHEAAQLGHVEANLRLGLLHYHRAPGLVGDNDVDAAKNLGIAKDEGNPEAAYYLARMYRELRARPEGDTLLKDAMLACLEQAAGDGHLEAQALLGHMLAFGELALWSPESAGQAAVSWLRKAAERDNVDAQCDLADLYRNKKVQLEPGESGDAAAVRWYTKATVHRSARAWLALAEMHEAGLAGTERGPEANRKMVECLAKAAAQGDRALQFQLAEHYRNGTEGLETGAKGNEQAATWYALAEVKGHVEAKYRLGQFYRDGLAQPKGVEPKGKAAMNEAARLLEEADREGGHVHAGFELGEMLLDGLVGSSDAAANVRHAFRLMEPAAEQGDPNFQYRLAMRHLQRKADTPEEKREHDRVAQGWLQEAAKQNHLPALRQLASLHIAGRTGKSPEAANLAAMECINRAIDLKDQVSRGFLGWMYETGRAGIADLHESQCTAVAHYTELVQGDDPPPLAMRQLAIMGIEGRGGIEKGSVDKDAVELLEHAAEKGDGYAMHRLGRLHAQGGCGLDKDVAPDGKAVYWLTKAAEERVKPAKADLKALKAGKELEALKAW